MTEKRREIPVHWVVVADASRAQVFVSDLMLEELIPVEGRVHPASRLPSRELVAGDRGASRDFGTGMHGRFERHTEPHKQALETFAREVALLLREGWLTGRYQRLVIVAPPAFLGALRAELDAETTRRMVASIPHEWTTLPSAEIALRIRATLANAKAGEAATAAEPPAMSQAP